MANRFKHLIPKDGEEKAANRFAHLVPEDENAKREAYYRGPTAGGFPAGGRAKMIEALGNFPRSAAGVLGSMWDAVSSPVDTARAIGTLADQTGNLIGRKAAELRTGRDIAPSEDMPEEAPKAVAGALKDRYGSLDAIGNTLVEDPAGAMMDFSALGMATRIPGVAKAAAAVEPVNVLGKTARGVAQAVIPEGKAADLYESAAKFSTTMKPDERARVTQTALDNEIMPTKRGMDKLQGKIDTLEDQLEDLINRADYYGTQVPAKAVFQHLKDLRQQVGGFNFEASGDLAKIDDMARKFGQYLKDNNIQTVSVGELQKFKRNLYRRNSYDAKRGKGNQTAEDTRKAMARGAKDAIASRIKEAPEINALLGDLIDAQPHLQRAANRIDNHNLLSIRTPLGASAGGALADVPGAVGGAIISAIDNPQVKAGIAIALNKLKQGDIEWLQNNMATTGVREALYLAGNAEQIIGGE